MAHFYTWTWLPVSSCIRTGLPSFPWFLLPDILNIIYIYIFFLSSILVLIFLEYYKCHQITCSFLHHKCCIFYHFIRSCSNDGIYIFYLPTIILINVNIVSYLFHSDLGIESSRYTFVSFLFIFHICLFPLFFLDFLDLNPFLHDFLNW